MPGPISQTYRGPRDECEECVDDIDALLREYKLDDECRDRVTDLIVEAFKRKRLLAITASELETRGVREMKEFKEYLYRARLFDLAGNVRLNGTDQLIVVSYPSQTRLGKRLRVDTDGRAVLANYIRQDLGLPRGETNMTRFEWRGE